MRRSLTLLAVLALLAAPALAKGRTSPAPPRAETEDTGYFSNFITGPGGNKIPIQNYPGSATVVTRKMMDDFQVRSVCGALLLAPGVTASCR
jgi:outer membrane receptor for ferric coprogen and ferric-rhodotorulic acid